jgi:hypothetical protein
LLVSGAMAQKITYHQFLTALAILDKLDDTPLKESDFHPNTFGKIEKKTNKVFEVLGLKYRVESMVVGSSASIRSAVIHELKRAEKRV